MFEERPLDKAVDSRAGGIVDAVELNRKAHPLILAAVNPDDAATGLRRLRVIREVECQFYHRVFGDRGLRLYQAADRCEVCSRGGQGFAAEQAGDQGAKRRSLRPSAFEDAHARCSTFPQDTSYVRRQRRTTSRGDVIGRYGEPLEHNFV